MAEVPNQLYMKLLGFDPQQLCDDNLISVDILTDSNRESWLSKEKYPNGTVVISSRDRSYRYGCPCGCEDSGYYRINDLSDHDTPNYIDQNDYDDEVVLYYYKPLIDI